jgi:penicillin-insensitive murein endopeptidase
VPKPSTLALALALLALSPAAFATGPSRDGAARRAHHHRRAHANVPAGRAPRAGAAAKLEPARRPVPVKAQSIGSPNEGKLEGGVHVDLSKPYYRVVPAYESGDVRWGLPQLVNLIDRGARSVHKRFPGAVLDVGDLSQRGGGDLLRHHSHETGRDADLGFYTIDARGRSVHARHFVKFESGTLESTNVPGARFDLARNWLFVQEMLTDPGAHVSHIFISAPLRAQLLAWARPRVSRALWERAAQVMMQPTHSLPHDDHFHVRISCPHGMKACIELAKVPQRKQHRMAKKAASHGPRLLKTPSRPGAHPPPHEVARKPTHPPAAGVAPQAPALDLPEDPYRDDVEGDVDTD